MHAFTPSVSCLLGLSGRPDSCSGIVSCFVSGDGDSIIVTLNDQMETVCIHSYLFELGHDKENVSVKDSSAFFPRDKVAGSEHLNQMVHILDPDGRNGATPCMYNITSKPFTCRTWNVVVLFHYSLISSWYACM